MAERNDNFERVRRTMPADDRFFQELIDIPRDGKYRGRELVSGPFLLQRECVCVCLHSQASLT